MVKKAYIQDLCGDEDTVVIDCAILECRLKDAIFERVVGKTITTETLKELNDCIYDVIGPYLPPPPSMIIDLVLKRGNNDEGITRTLLL